MNGKPDTPKPTAEQAAAIDAEIAQLQSAGGGWDAGVKYLSEAGDPETAHRLARNDWYRLRRSLEIIKVLVYHAISIADRQGNLLSSIWRVTSPLFGALPVL